MRYRSAPAALAVMGVVGPALAFDGWHLERAVTIPGGAAGWDYVSFDPSDGRVLIGHRQEGLQAYDPKTARVFGVVAGTAAASSNGAVAIPEYDLGIANNRDGTVIPFRLSTLAAGPALKLAANLDTSHYDPASRRLVVNVAPGPDGTELVMLDVPSLADAGRLKVASRKVEGADADGHGSFFLAAQDLDQVYRIDTAAGRVTATFGTAPTCGRPSAVAVDGARERVFVSCRGHDVIKPSLIVLDGASGRIVYSAEIGGGSDSLIYDADLRRIFSANGVSANLSVFEQVDADTYKLVETLGTRAGVRTMAMDHVSKTLYAVAAEGSADPEKPIFAAVSPFSANTFFPDTFTVLAYGRR